MSHPGLTRRSALVTIGQAAVASSVVRALTAETNAALQLPPGVYLASSDHLGHALMSSERYHRIPLGCPTDYIRPRTGPYSPLFFNQSEFHIISRLVDLMLGTPTASDNNSQAESCKEVAEWIDLRVATAAAVRQAARQLDPLCRTLAIAYLGAPRVQESEHFIAESTCRDGLEWLASAAVSRRANGFLSLPLEQQIAVLTSISDGRPDKQTEDAGTKFFAYLKAETIRGYYTSQAGLHELDFKGNSFYARSPGCDRPVRST